jgi:hypothetical protein
VAADRRGIGRPEANSAIVRAIRKARRKSDERGDNREKLPITSSR